MQIRHLLVGGFSQLDSPVSDIRQEEPGQPINVTLALVVEDVRPFAPLDDRQLAALLELREVDPEVLIGEFDEFLWGVFRSHHHHPLRAFPHQQKGSVSICDWAVSLWGRAGRVTARFRVSSTQQRSRAYPRRA